MGDRNGRRRFMNREQLDQLLERFEEGWRSGTAPAIGSFLFAANLADIAARRELLQELVKIDLDYRWRSANAMSSAPAFGNGGRRLEDYVREHPELGPAQKLPAAFIGEEYRVRQRWGDRPGHAEYAARFPESWPQLRPLLTQLDSDLAREFARNRPAASARSLVSAATPSAETSAASSVTSIQIVESTKRFRLFAPTPAAADAALADLPKRFPEPRALARELIQRGWLTPYQVNQLFQGRAAELWLEPYVILERLGEGGMGQVFKARHVDMQRVVALKLIRKELLVDAEAVSRFHREVQVISQLTHPHVIHAYDAALTRTPPFLVTEYVEGVSLNQLVERQGPLSVAQACEYIRQAALGLQHIHERGLAHRDIKPGNLLVSAGQGSQSAGVVKIMDLGLARLMNPVHRAAGDVPTASGPVMMGTLDYMAPEQALDFRQADIRADIYSLGCTLYFLLTGQPPFPEGTSAQKLLMHQMKEPVPLEQLRSDVPVGLSAMLRRMMAKQPADRMQAPAEVAWQLAPFSRETGAPLALLVPAGVGTVAAAPSALPLSMNRGAGALIPVAARNAIVARPPEVIVLDVRPSRPSRRLNRVRGWLTGSLPPSRRRAVLIAGFFGLVVGGFGWLLARSMFGKSEEVFLSDLPELNVVVRYKLGKNGQVPGGLAIGAPDLLSIKGNFTPKGICTPPMDRSTARVSYRLDKQYRRFKATVGLNDPFPESPTALTFAVSGDGRILWQSLPIKKQGEEQEVDIAVSGVELLELTVSCPGPNTGGPDGRMKAFPVWVQPRLIK